MSNIYRYKFYSNCPTNGEVIQYHFELISEKMVIAEHVQTACAINRLGFHEDIADRLHDAFGGKQTLTATHHGVEIETRRGWE